MQHQLSNEWERTGSILRTFRRHVQGTSSLGSHFVGTIREFPTAGQLPTQSEIKYFDVAADIKTNIVGLREEISVRSGCANELPWRHCLLP